MGKQRPFPLTQPTYGVAIHWDQLAKNVDLDLQAVIVDDGGVIVDAVYYNNLLAMNGAVGLSGDDLGDESIWIRLNKLPSQVRLIIFVVAAYSGGHLRDVTNGRIVVLERQAASTVKFKEFKMERSRSDADLVAMFKRFKDDTWGLVRLDEPAEKGSHFLDILEPTIGDLIRSEIPLAPAYQKVAFIMDKGAVADLPQAATLRRLVVGVGGTLMCDEAEVHVELCALFYNTKGEQAGMVDGESTGMYGVERTTDSSAGGHLGNDETLTIDLFQIPEEVVQVFLILLVLDGTFKSVEHAYARVVDQALSELVRYDIPAGNNDSGLVIARLLRSSDKRWGIQSVGKFFRSSYMLEELNLLFSNKPNNSKVARKAAYDSNGSMCSNQASRRGLSGGSAQSAAEADRETSGPAADLTGSRPGEGRRHRSVASFASAEDNASQPDVQVTADPDTGGTGGTPRMVIAPVPDIDKQGKKGGKAFVSAPRRHTTGGFIEDTENSEEGSKKGIRIRASEFQSTSTTGRSIRLSLGEASPLLHAATAAAAANAADAERRESPTSKIVAPPDASDQRRCLDGDDDEISGGLQVCRGDCGPALLQGLFAKKDGTGAR